MACQRFSSTNAGSMRVCTLRCLKQKPVPAWRPAGGAGGGDAERPISPNCKDCICVCHQLDLVGTVSACWGAPGLCSIACNSICAARRAAGLTCGNHTLLFSSVQTWRSPARAARMPRAASWSQTAASLPCTTTPVSSASPNNMPKWRSTSASQVRATVLSLQGMLCCEKRNGLHSSCCT